MSQKMDFSAWCDCHAHVFGSSEKYPVSAHTKHVPHDADWAAYGRMLDSLGIGRGVLVQPSAYGTDNRYLIFSLHHLGDRVRGVGVISPETTSDELEELHHAGVRGVRINAYANSRALDDFEDIAEIIKPLGWHLQVLLPKSEFMNFHHRLSNCPVPVVLDHFAGLSPKEPLSTQRKLIDVMSTGNVWVKVAAPYLYGSCSPESLDDYGELISNMRKDRLLWGTDWPHLVLQEAGVSTKDLFSLLSRWFPDESIREEIAKHNPARLYGFSS